MNTIHTLSRTPRKGLRPLTFAVLGALLAQGAVAEVLTENYEFNLDFSSPGYSKGVQSQHGPLG